MVLHPYEVALVIALVEHRCVHLVGSRNTFVGLGYKFLEEHLACYSLRAFLDAVAWTAECIVRRIWVFLSVHLTDSELGGYVALCRNSDAVELQLLRHVVQDVQALECLLALKGLRSSLRVHRQRERRNWCLAVVLHISVVRTRFVLRHVVATVLWFNLYERDVVVWCFLTLNNCAYTYVLIDARSVVVPVVLAGVEAIEVIVRHGVWALVEEQTVERLALFEHELIAHIEIHTLLNSHRFVEFHGVPTLAVLSSRARTECCCAYIINVIAHKHLCRRATFRLDSELNGCNLVALVLVEQVGGEIYCCLIHTRSFFVLQNKTATVFCRTITESHCVVCRLRKQVCPSEG